jgi:hypothetical protein
VTNLLSVLATTEENTDANSAMFWLDPVAVSCDGPTRLSVSSELSRAHPPLCASIAGLASQAPSSKVHDEWKE